MASREVLEDNEAAGNSLPAASASIPKYYSASIPLDPVNISSDRRARRLTELRNASAAL
jgi:hypothetical protein